MIKQTKILTLNDNAFKNYKIVIHQGGTGSSKTYSNLQYIINLAEQMKNIKITVISESIPHLKEGVIEDSNNIIKNQNLNTTYNVQDRVFTFTSGSKIKYTPADRVDLATGPRRFMLYGNEINSYRESIWEEFARRSQYVLADFNPVAKFWLEKWLAYQKDYTIIKSNYLDNPYLPTNEREKIEKRVGLDKNFKRIHIDCEYGNADDLVFENIILIDEFPKDLKYTYGLDFGFVAPTALVKVAENGDDIYIEQSLYRAGMNTRELIEQAKQICNNDKVVADNEDPRMIMELMNAGINVFRARKGAGSVKAGISYLQGKTIHIVKVGLQTIKEFRELMYATNSRGELTGDFTGEDHCFTAETLVKTINGNKKIIALKKGELVLTTNGFKKVLNVWNNGIKNIKKYKIDVGRYSDYLYLCSTENHKLKINNEWKQIRELKVNDKITLNRSLTVYLTTSIRESGIIQDILQECIQQFGNTIMGRYQIVFTYIILTVILKITKLKIFVSEMLKNICQNILKFGTKIIKRKQKPILLKSDPLQANGIKAKWGGRGTENTLKHLTLGLLITEWLIVKFVTMNLKRKHHIKDFVLINVKVNIAELWELIIYRKNVNYATNYLQQTNIVELNFVQKVVVEDIQSLNDSRQVYDLEVEQNSEYFANGILVHNSVDATRYAISDRQAGVGAVSSLSGKRADMSYRERYG